MGSIFSSFMNLGCLWGGKFYVLLLVIIWLLSTEELHMYIMWWEEITTLIDVDFHIFIHSVSDFLMGDQDMVLSESAMCKHNSGVRNVFYV